MKLCDLQQCTDNALYFRAIDWKLSLWIAAINSFVMTNAYPAAASNLCTQENVKLQFRSHMLMRWNIFFFYKNLDENW